MFLSNLPYCDHGAHSLGKDCFLHSLLEDGQGTSAPAPARRPGDWNSPGAQPFLAGLL
jgi:hypothetical protein